MKEAYTYRIGWSELDLYYYGVRTGNKKWPDEDFWIEYFTSSPGVKTICEKYGDPDVQEIRKRFDSRMKAMRWEIEVIRRFAKSHPKYINNKPKEIWLDY